MEAPPGIEPGMKVLQTSALPLGYGANFGAGDGARTRHLRLGKAALYQMSYSRIVGICNFPAGHLHILAHSQRVVKTNFHNF